MTLKEKLEIYRNALINISKRAGACWDKDKWCNDSSEVAHRALTKAEPKLYNKIDALHYENVTIYKNGKVRIKGIKL